MRTVCVEAEEKNAKLNNQTRLNGLVTIGEHQSFLEEGKLIVGGAAVACVVSHHYPIFMNFGNTVAGCWFFQILPCSTFS